MRVLFALIVLASSACADVYAPVEPQSLPPAPAGLDMRLSTYLEASRGHTSNYWRDTPPLNDDATVNGYVEIPRGESTKWEFSIPLNRREIDRMIPRELGGYPVNYGFLPRTISYDGDPADILVLGAPLAPGEIKRTHVVGLMRMIDNGDLDSKVVVIPPGADRATVKLDEAERTRIARFFDVYKNHEGKVTRVTGWGDATEALEFLRHTAGFFEAGNGDTQLNRK